MSALCGLDPDHYTQHTLMEGFVRAVHAVLRRKVVISMIIRFGTCQPIGSADHGRRETFSWLNELQGSGVRRGNSAPLAPRALQELTKRDASTPDL